MCTAEIANQRKVNATLRQEVIKCIDCLKEQPNLDKY